MSCGEWPPRRRCGWGRGGPPPSRRAGGRGGGAPPTPPAGGAGGRAPGGHLLVETSERQAARATEIVASSGLIPRVASSDELSATVVIGTRHALPSGLAPR